MGQPEYKLTLSESQRRALLGLIADYMRCPYSRELFVDPMRKVSFTPGELLQLVMNAEYRP